MCNSDVLIPISHFIENYLTRNDGLGFYVSSHQYHKQAAVPSISPIQSFYLLTGT